ncbi:MAG: hypothetical protein R3C05_08290 [Pirellulaceae bacterium]
MFVIKTPKEILEGILEKLMPDGQLKLTLLEEPPKSFHSGYYLLTKTLNHMKVIRFSFTNNEKKPEKHDQSLATAPRSLKLSDIDESRQLIEVSQQGDYGIGTRHYIFSHSTHGGSIARPIDLGNNTATAKTIKDDFEHPLQ